MTSFLAELCEKGNVDALIGVPHVGRSPSFGSGNQGHHR